MTLTPYPISYEYKPDKASRLATNIYRKWSYRTTSPIFSYIYSKVEEMTPSVLKGEERLSRDSSVSIITVTYKDGEKKTKPISPEDKRIGDYFRLIKKLVGKCEYIPAVLLTDEDYSESEGE